MRGALLQLWLPMVHSVSSKSLQNRQRHELFRSLHLCVCVCVLSVCIHKAQSPCIIVGVQSLVFEIAWLVLKEMPRKCLL